MTTRALWLASQMAWMKTDVGCRGGEIIAAEGITRSSASVEPQLIGIGGSPGRPSGGRPSSMRGGTSNLPKIRMGTEHLPAGTMKAACDR